MAEAKLLQAIMEVASVQGSQGSMNPLLNDATAPRWLQAKSREERAIAVAEIQRVIDIIGGIGVVNTHAIDVFERTSAKVWDVVDRVDDPKRRALVEGFATELMRESRDGILGAAQKGRNALTSLIDKRFTPGEQRSMVERIFGV